MNKKALSIVLALAITLGLSLMAIAKSDTPGGTVNMDAISDIELTQAELTQAVAGYVEFDSSNDGPKLQSLKLEVQKDGSNQWTTIDYVDYDKSTGCSEELTDRSGDPTGIEFDFADWTVKAEGVYELRVTANFVGSYAKAVETITVEVTMAADPAEENDTRGEEGDNYPAAPAVAAKILKELGIPNHYDGGNYIADIAKEMGPKGEFQGVQKSDPEAYEAAIQAFLENHDAWGVEITKGKHQNQPDQELEPENNNSSNGNQGNNGKNKS